MPRLLLSALLLSVAPLAAQDRPNIVVVMTDDQGYGDFGFVGNQVIRTPHLDQMAAESAQLTQFYVSPVCSPTRAALMTGRYNYRTRVVDTFKGRSMMDTAEETVAEALLEGGYATGLFGKWHLGDNFPLRPQDQGFEEVLMHQGGGLAQSSETIGNDRRYTDAILLHNGKEVQTKGYCTDVYFDAALDFITESSQGGKPFFSYIATNAPHGPYHDAPKKLYQEYLDQPERLRSLMRTMPSDRLDRDGLNQIEVLASIAAMVTNVDDNMGRLMAHLEKLGIADNTLVIFLTDNGANTNRYAASFRGNKTQVHEGGVHTVFLARWPERLPADVLSPVLSAHIDIKPTLLAAAGIEHEKRTPRMDGRNLLPALTGEIGEEEWGARTITIQSHRGNQPKRFHNFMIRDHLGWKLLHASGFGKESFEGEPQFELYHLPVDPGESQNQVDARPEIVERLKKAYNHWFDSVSSTRENNYAPPRIVLGSAKENPAILTGQDARVDGEEIPAGWEVKITQAGRYELTCLDVEEFPEGATFSAKVGPKALGKPSDSPSFIVELPPGLRRLSAWVEIEGKTKLAYQLRVKRLK